METIRSAIERIESNIANTYDVLSDAGADMPEQMNSHNLANTAANIKAVSYGKEQFLTDEQKNLARYNIGAMSNVVENLTNSIVYNHSDKCTVQLQSCYRVGKICMFTVQLNAVTTITDNYGFTIFTLPVAPVSRVWINNATQFYMDRGNGAVRVNGESLPAGNKILTGFFIIYE